MGIKVAIIGAGRMGEFVAKQLPKDVEKLIIDRNMDKAENLAKAVGGHGFTELSEAKDANAVAMVLPAGAIPDVAEKLSKVVSKGCIIMNLATSGVVPKELKDNNAGIHFVDCKIIGHAASIKQGAPNIVVVNTEDSEILKTCQYVLSGYGKVISGDSDLVPVINTIGSREGIRAAVGVRKELRAMGIPEEWQDVVIYTVCAGTMRSYVEKDLGHFALELAQKLEAEND